MSWFRNPGNWGVTFSSVEVEHTGARCLPDELLAYWVLLLTPVIASQDRLLSGKGQNSGVKGWFHEGLLTSHPQFRTFTENQVS